MRYVTTTRAPSCCASCERRRRTSNVGASRVGPPVDPRPGFPFRDVEIAAGLEAGDEVVLDAPLELADGDPAEAMTPPPRVTGTPQDECNPVRFVVRDDETVLDTRLRISGSVISR